MIDGLIGGKLYGMPLELTGKSGKAASAGRGAACGVGGSWATKKDAPGASLSVDAMAKETGVE